jgi:hypothetical protein
MALRIRFKWVHGWSKLLPANDGCCSLLGYYGVSLAMSAKHLNPARCRILDICRRQTLVQIDLGCISIITRMLVALGSDTGWGPSAGLGTDRLFCMLGWKEFKSIPSPVRAADRSGAGHPRQCSAHWSLRSCSPCCLRVRKRGRVSHASASIFPVI